MPYETVLEKIKKTGKEVDCVAAGVLFLLTLAHRCCLAGRCRILELRWSGRGLAREEKPDVLHRSTRCTFLMSHY